MAEISPLRRPMIKDMTVQSVADHATILPPRSDDVQLLSIPSSRGCRSAF